MSVVLTTDRLTLRTPEPGDWPHWRAMMASERSSYIGGPLAEPLAWRAFCHILGHWIMRGYGLFTICEGGQPIGMAGPWSPAGWPEPEIGWNLWTDTVEGRGIAFEAAQAARTHAYTTLGWTTAVSYIDPANTRSLALAERLGCSQEIGAPTPDNKPITVWRHPGAAA